MNHRPQLTLTRRERAKDRRKDAEKTTANSTPSKPVKGDAEAAIVEPAQAPPKSRESLRYDAAGEAIYDPLLSVDQVSDWLGVPKATLYQWRSRHQGPCAIKVGNAIRYRRRAIEEFLDQNTESRSA